MAHELEYVVDNALLDCSEGTVPMFFHPTPRNIRVQGLKVANASDKLPIVNIPSFVICKKLSQQSGFPVPCVPVPQTWQDTYPVQINKQELLVYRSCIKCTSGQGTIEFLSSGQTPVGAADLAALQQLQKEAEEALKQAEAEQNAVGESGLVEGMIPVWGSGRDTVHALQTGNWGMAALNGAFLVWDVASIAAGAVSFGTATVAMQAGKAGVRGLIKAGVKTASKELLQKVAQLSLKAALAKEALQKALQRMASTRVCVIACFPAGTPIAVQEGQKNIEDVVAGDWVWSRHEETGELALKRVVSTIRRESDHLVHLQLGGERIRTTVEHPFWVADRGWVKAGALQVGDLVGRADGAAVPVTEVEHQTEFEGNELPLVYNIEVAEWHSYLVGKWLWWVHNSSICHEVVEKVTKEGAEKVAKEGADHVDDLPAPRLGNRRVSDADYKKLRDQTPTNEIRDKVNKDYVEGMPDEALPGMTVNKRLHADHVVPMDTITRMEGFDKLTDAQKLEVLNNPDNFIGLSEAANTSKGSKSYADWIEHKKSGTPVSPEFRERMMRAEQESAKKLQKQIDDFVRLNN